MVEVEGRAKYFPAKPSMPRVHTHPSGDVALTLPCPESPLADVIAHDCKHRSQNCSTLVQIVWRAQFFNAAAKSGLFAFCSSAWSYKTSSRSLRTSDEHANGFARLLRPTYTTTSLKAAWTLISGCSSPSSSGSSFRGNSVDCLLCGQATSIPG